MTDRSSSRIWAVIDVMVILSAIMVALIVLRQSLVVMPMGISNAFALDNPLPSVALAFQRFERMGALGISASLFLLGYGLIRKMLSPSTNLSPFLVVSSVMVALVFSSLATWRVSPALSWTRPDAAEVSRQLWSAYTWSSSQSDSLPGWAGNGHQQWRLPGGLVAMVDTRDNMARVSVAVSAGLSCQYLIDELSSQYLPEGAELRVDNQPVDGSGYGDACQGDTMKEVLLVSKQWPEQS